MAEELGLKQEKSCFHHAQSHPSPPRQLRQNKLCFKIPCLVFLFVLKNLEQVMHVHDVFALSATELDYGSNAR